VGSNTHHFDEAAHIKAMSTAKLQETIEQMEEGILEITANRPGAKLDKFVTYVAKLRLEKAERIGQRKTN
jgi:hypothetical protein